MIITETGVSGGGDGGRIRPLEAAGWSAAIEIVNGCWRSLYAGFVNPALLSGEGCREWATQLEREFRERRLEEYVWEGAGRILGLLSVGDTADPDRPGAFEIWRLYLAPEARGKGAGGLLLAHAEDLARQRGRRETLIWAFRENTGALRFYEKHGYQQDRAEYLGPPYLANGVRFLKYI